MEEDNAHEIFKAIAEKKDETANAVVHFKNKTFRAKLHLYGNILSCTATDEFEIPLIFVLERLTISKLETEDASFAFALCFLDTSDNVSLSFESDRSRELWMLKVATCSYQMSRAELDEMAYKFYTLSTSGDSNPEDVIHTHTFQNYYLAHPYKIKHNFAIYQQNNLPSRRVIFDESLWESKLSLLLPLEMIKIYRKWIAEFCYLLESRQHSWPSFSVSALHDVLREVRENAETYEQCFEFLQNYSGPLFRKSTEKHRVAFGPVPTNLHVHSYSIAKEVDREVLSCGTVSTIPLRFQHGGLHRLYSSLDIDNTYHDNLFWSKRQILLDLKRNIGQISHRLEIEWKIASFGKPDKVCLEIHSGIKQVYERLKDNLRWISGVEQCAEFLMEEEKRRCGIGIKNDNIVLDSLQNQMDNVEAMLISLNTKIAAIDTLNDHQTEREIYEKSAKEAMSNCLNMLLVLANSILESQLFGLVLALQKNSSAHAYFHIQVRTDFVLSQAITIASTAILNQIHRGWAVLNGMACDLLLVVFSFLSVYGDERGMVEDAWEAWRMLESRVEFHLVRSPSVVCSTCVPLVGGNRSKIKISIPLPQNTYDSLPAELTERESIFVRPAFFNIGVNHEATLGQSFGGLSFEAAVNQEGAERLQNYSNITGASSQAREAVMELVNAVTCEPSRKNLSIFEWSMASCELLSGQAVICCKSGKDRTGMAVTLEQGRVLRETCGLNAAQVLEVVNSLRRDGVRRENCVKNVGKAMYSFSPFQMHFLPKSFRPPNGTYAQGIAS